MLRRGAARKALAPSLALALPLCVFLAAACATPPPDPAALAVAPAWPPEPNAARIRWTAEIRGAVDLGIRPGFLRRIWNAVVGHHEPRLVRPHGLSIDPGGRLWVADPGARLVHVFDPAQGRYRSLPADGDPTFRSPIAIVHDRSGVAYVSDSALRVIRRFDSKGRYLGEWDGDGELTRPTGLAFDPETGLLWVADTGSHRLLAFDHQGRIRRYVGARGQQLGRFNFPTHLTIDGGGRLYVTDTLNFRVQILTNEGEPITAFGQPGDGPGSLTKPKGIGVDADGHIYVVDALFDNVQIFDEAGRVLLHFGGHGPAPGEFWLPAGLWIADDGKIYVADAYNHRIQVFQYLGE